MLYSVQFLHPSNRPADYTPNLTINYVLEMSIYTTIDIPCAVHHKKEKSSLLVSPRSCFAFSYWKTLLIIKFNRAEPSRSQTKVSEQVENTGTGIREEGGFGWVLHKINPENPKSNATGII